MVLRSLPHGNRSSHHVHDRSLRPVLRSHPGHNTLPYAHERTDCPRPVPGSRTLEYVRDDARTDPRRLALFHLALSQYKRGPRRKNQKHRQHKRQYASLFTIQSYLPPWSPMFSLFSKTYLCFFS